MESTHPRIVIVEDDEPTRRFLADNLAADGFEPLEAASARDGLRLIANHAPALAVLDLGLPDRDGLDVLRELRGGGGRHQPHRSRAAGRRAQVAAAARWTACAVLSGVPTIT